MKCTEYRIGNIAHDEVSGALMRICELNEENELVVGYVIDRSKFPLPDGWKLRPIPLTEEWLLKFGFIKMDWTENENCYEKSFVLQKDDKEGYNLMDNDVATLQQFKYVHQLQNLYFALTGEELTLKES